MYFHVLQFSRIDDYISVRMNHLGEKIQGARECFDHGRGCNYCIHHCQCDHLPEKQGNEVWPVYERNEPRHSLHPAHEKKVAVHMLYSAYMAYVCAADIHRP